MAELPDAKYGENKLFEEQQRVMPAPEAQALPDAPQPQAPDPSLGAEPGPAPLGMFGGPTSRPGEPVTSGSPLGPGPNSLNMGPNAPLRPQVLSQTLASYAAIDDSGVIADIAQMLDGMNL